MLREETEFLNNAIGIDPSDCGCTDCLVGNSIPENDPDVEKLLRAYFEEGREIVNRTYASALVAYKDRNGNYTYSPLFLTDPAAEIHIVKPEDPFYDEGFVICETDTGYEPNIYPGDDEDSVAVVSLDEDEEVINAAIENHFKAGTTITNRTGSVLVLHESYGEYGYLTIEPMEGTDVSIIR